MGLIFYKEVSPLIMRNRDPCRGAIVILPAVQMDTQAGLGRLDKLLWFRHRRVPTWLCGIEIEIKYFILLLYMNLVG